MPGQTLLFVVSLEDLVLIGLFLIAVVDPKAIPDIEEVNMFKDDNTVIHMRKPTGKLDLIARVAKTLLGVNEGI